MLYLLALIMPPLAVLFCGRPISAILNLGWIIIGFLTVYVFSIFGLLAIPLAFIGAVIHAVLVVSKTSADERQRELITALGGTLPPRKNWELDAAAGLMTLVLIAAVIGIILSPKSAVIKIPAGPMNSQPSQVLNLPTLEGWTMDEVISRHGEPSTRDKTTGWAAWPTFRARFVGGAVVEVAQN
jgi:hypothetical protein